MAAEEWGLNISCNLMINFLRLLDLDFRMTSVLSVGEKLFTKAAEMIRQTLSGYMQCHIKTETNRIVG